MGCLAAAAEEREDAAEHRGNMPRFGNPVYLGVRNSFQLLGSAAAEQIGLQFARHPARDAPVVAEIDAVGQAGVEPGEQGERLGPASGEALALPDLVQPAGIAAVAVEQVLAPNAQPA